MGYVVEVRKYLMLKKRYLPLVLSGKKRISIRRRTRLKEGDLFYIHSGGKVWAVGRVTKVERVKKSEIGPEHAKLEGMDYEDLKKELNRIYGKKDIPLYVIHFELVKVFDEPFDVERRFYGDLTPGEIARIALEYNLPFDEEARGILKRLAETNSIRQVALEMGGLGKRKKVRAVLRKAVEELRKRGIIS